MCFAVPLMSNWKWRDYMLAGRMEFSLHLHNAINSFGIIVIRCGEFLCIGVCWGFCGCTNQRIVLRFYTDIFAIWIPFVAQSFVQYSTTSYMYTGMKHVIRGDYSTLFVWPSSTCSDSWEYHQYIILCQSLFHQFKPKFKLKIKLNIFQADKQATQSNEMLYSG